MKKHVILFCFLMVIILGKVQSQVSQYGFSTANTNYTPIAGGTVWLSGNSLSIDSVSPEIALPFPFNFNNKNYTSLRISTEGFLQLGTPASSFNGSTLTPMSAFPFNASTTYDAAIVPLGVNLRASTATGANPEIRYANTGNEFIVQYRDMARNIDATERLFFQVRLVQGTNEIKFVFGNFSITNPNYVAIGLRGSFGDFYNLTIAGSGVSWLSPLKSSSDFTGIYLAANSLPANGLQYTWTPPMYKTLAPQYHSLPFIETFDNNPWQNFYTEEQLPDSVYWRSWPSRGNGSWRRHNTNIGATSASGWPGNNGSFKAVVYGGAARYQTNNNSPLLPGYLQAYADFSAPGNKYLRFDYYGPALSDSVGIYLSTDGGNTFERKGSVIGSGQTAWTEHTIDLGNSTSATCVIRFYGYGGGNYTNISGAENIGLDNMYVISANCGLATNLAASSIMPTSAIISWNAVQGASAYNYEVRTSGLPGSGAAGLIATGNTPNPSQNITGLTSTTKYTFYVQPATGTSCGWSFPQNFITACQAINNVPYFENFDNYAAPAFSNCDLAVDGNNDALKWKTESVSFANFINMSFPNVLSTYNAPYPANDWFITRGLQLSAGVPYSVSFKYDIYPTGQKLDVMVGTSQSAAALTIPIVSIVGQNIFAKLATGHFTPTATGVYYFGFHHTSPGVFARFVSIDDILIEETPPPPPCVTNISPVNGAIVNSLDVPLQWNTAPTASSYAVFISTNGGNTYSQVGETFKNSYTYKSAANDTIHWYVLAKNAGGGSPSCSANTTSFMVPLPNDCATAVNILYDTQYQGSTINATPSSGAPTCTLPGTTAGNDVWYSFIPVYGIASISFQGNSNLDAVMALYAGDCNALSLVNCLRTDPSGSLYNLYHLNPIQKYFLRIYTLQNGTPGSFQITIYSAVLLPVKMSTLTGERLATNKLRWTTFTEKDNRGFEMQRSINGENYSAIGTVPSKAPNGNSTTEIKYEFEDTRPMKGTNYYRLRQIDKDGKETMSNVVALKGDKVAKVEITSVFPNPASAILNVMMSAPAPEKMQLFVTDITGRLLMQQATMLNLGDNKIQLNIASLASGTYFVKAVCANGCEMVVVKFVKE